MMPVVFVGHGSPVNTIARNAYTEAWRAYGRSLPRPRAIVAISAHWYVPGIRVTTSARPPTVHDFNARFDPELFAFRYPAAGAPDIAERAIELLAPYPVERDDTTWGIDHGAYSVLAHLFPDADVPTIQISIDRSKSASAHYAIARKLAPLRDEGVLIVGSGNVVHNLELAEFERREPFTWASRFEERFRTRLEAGDHDRLVAYASDGDDAKLAIPTPEHYLPFLYVLAAQRTNERFVPICRGIEAGSLGMLSFATGT